MADGSPTMPARRLGRELKRLRDATGMTQAEVARRAGTYPTTVSKIETGDRNAPLSVLYMMFQLYGVEDAPAEALTQLALQAKEPGWWVDSGEYVADWFTEFVGLETAAKAVETFEALYVPGLLQTKAYTEAVTVAEAGQAAGAEAFARVRATRQQRLTGEAPMMLRAVLDEAVLHRQVGGPDVMREQLARLREATSRPNVTLQIVPFSVGAHPGMTGPFTILRFAEASMDVVFVELRGSAAYLEGSDDVDVHTTSFGQLSDLALGEDDTVALLNEVERRYQR